MTKDEPAPDETATAACDPPVRILVADDDENLLCALRRSLRRLGHDMAQAVHGHGALKRLDAEPFDLLLADLRMPGPDGMEVIRRAKRAYAPLYTVLMTVRHSYEIAIEAIKGGADDFLPKPFRVDQLEAVLNKFLEQLPRHAPRRRLGCGESPLPELVGTAPAMEAVYRSVRRVGSTESIPIDVRVVAATNQDLEEAVRQGRFREDLYYRVHVVPIAMPPLRERREDIPLLVNRFLSLAGAEDRTFEATAMETLQRSPWPGNVRELKNLVRRLCVMVPDSVIRLEHLPARYRADSGDASQEAGGLRQAKAGFERRYLEALLRRVGGNVAEAARRAGIGRPYLHTKLRNFGIDPNRFRGGGTPPSHPRQPLRA